MPDLDAIAIGAGHNGLTAGTMLAREGLRATPHRRWRGSRRRASQRRKDHRQCGLVEYRCQVHIPQAGGRGESPLPVCAEGRGDRLPQWLHPGAHDTQKGKSSSSRSTPPTSKTRSSTSSCSHTTTSKRRSGSRPATSVTVSSSPVRSGTNDRSREPRTIEPQSATSTCPEDVLFARAKEVDGVMPRADELSEATSHFRAGAN